MSFFGKLFGGLKWLGRMFTSDAAKRALDLADGLLPQILPLVREIQTFVPSAKNASLADILKVYAAFDKTLGDIKQDPISFGNALKNLAFEVAKDRLAVEQPGTANRLINFAIEAALLALKAK